MRGRSFSHLGREVQRANFTFYALTGGAAHPLSLFFMNCTIFTFRCIGKRSCTPTFTFLCMDKLSASKSTKVLWIRKGILSGLQTSDFSYQFSILTTIVSTVKIVCFSYIKNCRPKSLLGCHNPYKSNHPNTFCLAFLQCEF